MIIDQRLFDDLTAKAKASPRLRMTFDLRNSPEEGLRRMLNAIEPGTVMPIHRHPLCWGMLFTEICSIMDAGLE